MQLTSPGGNVLGGVYVAPYFATIDGGTPVPVICDDYADESWVGPPSWEANVTDVASLAGEVTASTTVLFDKSSATKQQQDYAEAAYLAEQLMNPATTCPKVADCVGDIQYAIWQLFDPTDNPFGQLSGNNLYNANYWLKEAANAGQVSSYSNVFVYSPVGGIGPPQEFLYVDAPSVPEASTPIQLGADLLVLVCLIGFFRGRKFQFNR